MPDPPPAAAAGGLPGDRGFSSPGDLVYSFAVEYQGPPLALDRLPRAIPLDFEFIPVAAVAVDDAAAVSGFVRLPVALPLEKSPPVAVDAAAAGIVQSGVEAAECDRFSPTSVLADEFVDDEDDDVSAGDAKVMDGAVAEGDEVDDGDKGEDADTDTVEMDWLVADESARYDDNEFDLSCGTSDEEARDGKDVKCSPVVTFQTPGDSSESVSPRLQNNATDNEPLIRSVPRRSGCFSCGKGGRFSDKEACLSCNARYCARCVLEVMGSMPEGRKCVDCIGRPILESRRSGLGKCSRLLKKLLSPLEVEQAMLAERECKANQLRPEDVFVNGSGLTYEELSALKGCSCPPAKLRPGYFWYDKVSGFWGKEGHRPHQIISPNLNVGGTLEKNASNGNTGILINGREITKAEMQMLKWAGVQCAGKPHFWVNADGTYQEEGQKTVKGKIWDKPIVKILSPVLSLPTPKKANTSPGAAAINSEDRALPGYIEQKATQKLLLVGLGGSGTSTVYKQAKFLYKNNAFSPEEREEIKTIIQSAIYNYLGILLEGRERFEEEFLGKREGREHGVCSGGDGNVVDNCEVSEYSIAPRLKAFSDWLLEEMASGNLEAIFPVATREYARRVEELWNDDAIQATHRRRNELPFLSTSASYFLERAVDISRLEYEPSDTDILYADGITSSNGLASMDFAFPRSSYDDVLSTYDLEQQDTLLRYQLIRMHDRALGEKCKWLEMFDDVRLIIFCAAVTDYDEFFEDSDGAILNKMIESRKLFETLVKHPTLEQMSFLLILTKTDQIDQKISTTPLTVCEWFDDFAPVLSANQRSCASGNLRGSATLGETAVHYIGVKFKRLFYSLTGRKLFVAPVNSLVRDQVDAAMRYAREVMRFEDEKPPFGSSETAWSNEPSSYTH